jgi:hypothetical protein
LPANAGVCGFKPPLAYAARRRARRAVTEDRLQAFVAAVRDDPRVVGVARQRNVASLPSYVHALVVTTWDGIETLPARLPDAATAAFAGTATRVFSSRPDWLFALGADGFRLDVELRRVGDLKPTPDGAGAVAVHDPRGLLEQWIRYSTDAHGTEPAGCRVPDHDESVFRADIDLRLYESERVLLLPEDGGRLRHARDALREDDPVEAALLARIDAMLRGVHLPGRGVRMIGGVGRVEWFEAFLKAADDEGFKGDRVLFGEAVKRLRDLSGREPVFEEGFVLPTFDAVEAAFALGEAVGGCQPPLVPGIWVGVGVTPKDALEFWAAPCVRIPHSAVACIDDLGDRDVVLRSAGRDAMVGALTTAIDAAWDRLPALIDRVREATNESVDPSSVLAALHLPRSFVERAKRHVAGALMCSRLTVALGLIRAAHDAAPLVARKLGLAAGRALSKR